eukprot:GILJ01012250.1.p1 GENE.GILJ01012250.1~~GILJ01012250.1.p1  ORF type:complete len:459 (+),score=92.43 GILJ01012250.1:171-1379(+)
MAAAHTQRTTSQPTQQSDHIEPNREINAEVETQSPWGPDGLLVTSELNRRVQELLGEYIVAERAFVAESVKKAIRLDQQPDPDDPDTLTSTMVDDVFWILSKCCRRSLSTADVKAAGAILMDIQDLLMTKYYPVLQKRVNQIKKDPYFTSRPVNGQHTGKGGVYLCYLNNADVSMDYLTKLQTELEQEFDSTFEHVEDSSKQLFKASLGTFQDVSGSLQRLLQAGQESVLQLVLPQLASHLQSFAGISYDLTEEEYAEMELHDPFVRPFVAGLDVETKGLKSCLTRNNYDEVIQLLVHTIAQRLEAMIFQKRFNQLGGLQLDKDVRSLVTYFSSITEKSVRQHLARLSQLASLLSLEKVNEVLEYWGQGTGAMAWKLSKTDVKKALLLRVDFRPEAVSQLRL